MKNRYKIVYRQWNVKSIVVWKYCIKEKFLWFWWGFWLHDYKNDPALFDTLEEAEDYIRKIKFEKII